MKTKLLFSLFVMVMAYSFSFAQSGRYKEPIMIPVEGGTFMMGSNLIANDEHPAHKVTLDDFYIGKYEVPIQSF